MTALAVATLPIDPAPASARAPVSASGTHFIGALQQAQAQATNSPAASTAGGTAAAPQASNANSKTSTADTQNGGDQTNAATGSTGAQITAVIIPLPVPLLLTQPLPAALAGSAKTSTQPAGVTGTPPLTSDATALPPPRIGPANALLGTTALSTAAAGTLSGTLPTSLSKTGIAAPLNDAAQNFAALANAAAQNNGTANPTPTQSAPAPAAGTATTATQTGQTGAGGQSLPAMAGTLGLRLATSASLLVSQPRTSLASFAPQSDTPAQGKAGTDAELAGFTRSLGSIDAKTTSTKTTETALGQLASGVTKDGAATAQSLEHAADDTASKALADAPPASASTPTTTPPLVATPHAATGAAEPPASLPTTPHAGVSEQVAVTLRQAAKDGNDHIQIQLQPADLGAVEVKLSINHDGRVTMVVSADRSDTLNMLKQDAGGLAQALRDAGLQTDAGSLSFNLRGGFQFSQQQTAGGAPLDDRATGILDLADAAALAGPALRAHSGSVDIQV